MEDWPGREAASRLRLWPVLDDLIAKLSANPAYDAALLLGSLARGEGDDYSDIDLMLVYCRATRSMSGTSSRPLRRRSTPG